MQHLPDMQEMAGTIRGARRILLATHAGPDGDGIGSMIALARALDAQGKQSTCLTPDPVPQRYSFLDPEGRIRWFQEAPDALSAEFDLAVVLDTHRWEMLEGMGEWLRGRQVPTIFLDHHPVDAPVRPGVYGDSQAAATGELVYRLLHDHLGWAIPSEVAEPLYVSISFDTNSFKYIRSNPACLLIAADLITRGVDTNRVYRHLFASNSRQKARLLGWVLSSVEFDSNGRLAYVLIPHRKMEELGLERDELRDSITHILEIQGVEVAATIKEMSPGEVKISLRSKGSCAINGIASGLGGGGHTLAAGCDFSGTVEQAWEALRVPLIEALDGNAAFLERR